ncbi:hypothetical protein C8D79_0338 [Bacteriovorax stolpii]|nr:hypothetical protein C8D79_0338 [Bacteriovorax stolpii]
MPAQTKNSVKVYQTKGLKLEKEHQDLLGHDKHPVYRR